MNIKLCLFALAACFVVAFCKVEVKLKKGTIRGKILKSREGRSYYSYTGVPFARPPVGELRFKAPEPVESWNGTLDATQFSRVCLQPGMSSPAVGEEDCLYLNVYSPETDAKQLPVMFWIHGGGYKIGTSNPYMYGPKYFMDKDVVLVSANYRLGILGFLSTEDDVLPGNYGMLDQVEALRWVKENIIKFNGDPDRVTIFGGSAGASSAGLHMLSPMSKGLFHKAILQSGSPLCKWVVFPPGIPSQRASAAATIAGCSFNGSEGISKCLRRLPAHNLIAIQNNMNIVGTEYFIVFNPVVENCNSDREAFLCRHPIYDFKQESFVPVIFGFNSGEGGLYAAAFYNKTSLVRPEFRSDFNHQVSIVSYYNLFAKPEFIDVIGEKVLNEYFPCEEMSDDTHTEAVQMFGDAMFTHCAIDMAFKFTSPVYGYFYDYQNEFSFKVLFGTCERPLGVTHCDEINSLFTSEMLNPKQLNDRDLEVSKLVVDIWYKFASSSTPTVNGLENGLAWPEFNHPQQLMLNLNSSRPSIIQNPRADTYKFWTNLPILSK